MLSAGSLKEVGKVLKLSYPTVRARLDRVIANLQELDRSRQAVRLGDHQETGTRRAHGGAGGERTGRN